MLSFREKIYSQESFIAKLAAWRKGNEILVFTNGCFDILHLGHADYLERARLLGDRLIVGINSDRSVAALKGKNRPIQNQKSRMAVLASLACIDAVLLFDESTPESLIQFIKPNILVKGGDWHPDKIAGAESVKLYGGKVIILPFIDGYSTTLIEQKILHPPAK